jgi:hypothetical protein
MSIQEYPEDKRKKAMHPYKLVFAQQVATCGGGYSVTVKPEWVGCQLHAVAVNVDENGFTVIIELWLEEETHSTHIVDPDDATTEHFETAKTAFAAALTAAAFPKEQSETQARRLDTTLKYVVEAKAPATVHELREKEWSTLFEGDNLAGLVRDTIKFLTNELYPFQMAEALMKAAREVSDAARANLKIAIEALQAALNEHAAKA